MDITWNVLISVLSISSLCFHSAKQTTILRFQTSNCSIGQIECGDSRCCCSNGSRNHKMLCSHTDPVLTYIPRPPLFVTDVRFTGNNLRQISEESLSNLTTDSVSVLQLDNNSIVNITPSAFGNLRSLQTLDLSHNIDLNQAQLRMALSSADKLMTLYLANIGLTGVSEKTFEPLNKSLIRLLDLSGNYLENSPNLKLSIFKAFPQLSKLYLENCELEKVTLASKLPLRDLNLRGNRIWPNPPSFCKDGENMLPLIHSINLDANQIESISNNSFSCLLTLRDLYLGGNRLAVLQNNWFISLPNLRRLFLDGMKVRMVIGPFAFNSARLDVLSLGNNGIKFTNENIQDMFGGLKNLRFLVISRNNCVAVENQAFVQMLSPMKNLQNLKLDEIGLKRIPEFLRVLKQLSYLSLSGNSIQSLTGSLKYAKRLKILLLAGNSISVIEKKDFPDNLIQTLKVVDLSDNPLSCSCRLLWFRTWIDETIKTNRTQVVGFPNEYHCKTPKQIMFVDFHPTKETCSYRDSMFPVYISSACAFFLLVISIFISLVYYKKRWYLSYWYYKLRRRKTINAERRALLNNTGYLLYDAYVIYHNNDRGFVHNDLRNLLEQRHGLKLHIPQQDGENGVKLEIMFDAIYASRLTIAIFSDNFSKDDECRFKFYVALDRAKAIQVDNVIVVLLDNIEKYKLTKYWRVIMSKMPTVVWSEMDEIRRVNFEEKIIKLINEL